MESPKDWGAPLSALLGAYDAQLKFSLAAIGGKDSMSGTFHNLHVPPTLCSFAVCMGNEERIIGTELKKPGNRLYLLEIPRDGFDLPEYEKAKTIYENLQEDIAAKRVVSSFVTGRLGLAEALSKMAFGNMLGIRLESDLPDLFASCVGSIVIEVEARKEQERISQGILLGEVIEKPEIISGEERLYLQ